MEKALKRMSWLIGLLLILAPLTVFAQNKVVVIPLFGDEPSPSFGDALPGDIISGKQAWVKGSAVTGTMPNVGQQNITPGTSAQTITQGYHDGTGQVAGDADLVPGNIRKDVSIFGVTGDYVGAGVPKTGQTISYGTRDDGALQQGVAWPNPRFTDNNNGTVTDNLTNLVWLKNANCFGAKNWTTALADANGLANGQCGLTDGSAAGDWWLPNLRQLQSLVDYGRYMPALPSGDPFTGVHFLYYWSSTTYEDFGGYAWSVHMGYGYVNSNFKTFTYHVWPVRAGQ